MKTTFPISTLALVPIFRIAPADLIPCEEESFFIKRWQKTKIVLCFPMTIMDLLEQKYCISWPISWIIAATHTYKSTKSCKDNHSECKNLVTFANTHSLELFYSSSQIFLAFEFSSYSLLFHVWDIMLLNLVYLFKYKMTLYKFLTFH